MSGEYFSYGGVVDAEVCVSTCNDRFELVGVVAVVEEFGDLFWQVWCCFSVERCSASVGWADEDVGLVYLNGGVFDWDSCVWKS
mgnify:CR=1 FL=1